MSTRCNVILHNRHHQEKAILYHHCDGDPDNMLPKLNGLLSQAGRSLEERGFSTTDPEKVAAMLVALSVDEAGIPAFQPCLTQHEDIRHLYRVFLKKSGPEVVCDH